MDKNEDHFLLYIKYFFKLINYTALILKMQHRLCQNPIYSILL